jgi:hypothetical protein
MSFRAKVFQQALEHIPGTRDYKAKMERRARLLEDMDRVDALQSDQDFQWWVRHQLGPYIQDLRGRIMRPDTSCGETLLARHLVTLLSTLGADLGAFNSRLKAEASRLENELRRDFND